MFAGTGAIAEQKFDEPGYIAQPPCLWGEGQGLEPMPLVQHLAPTRSQRWKTTFLFIEPSFSSHVCSSVQIPETIPNLVQLMTLCEMMGAGQRRGVHDQGHHQQHVRPPRRDGVPRDRARAVEHNDQQGTARVRRQTGHQGGMAPPVLQWSYVGGLMVTPGSSVGGADWTEAGGGAIPYFCGSTQETFIIRVNYAHIYIYIYIPLFPP